MRKDHRCLEGEMDEMEIKDDGEEIETEDLVEDVKLEELMRIAGGANEVLLEEEPRRGWNPSRRT